MLAKPALCLFLPFFRPHAGGKQRAFHKHVKKPVHFPVREHRKSCIYAGFYSLHCFRCWTPRRLLR